MYKMISALLVFLLSTATVVLTKTQPRIEDTMRENGCQCNWTQWMNNDDYNPNVGDDNTYSNLRKLHHFCQEPSDIQCRSISNPQYPWSSVKSRASTCNVTSGVYCESRMIGRRFYACLDYDLRVLCCDCPQPTTPMVTTTADVKPTTEMTTEEVTEEFMFDPYTEPKVIIYDDTPSSGGMLIPIILISIICGVIAIFILMIFYCRKRCQSEREEDVHQEYYSYSPPKNPAQTLDFYVEHNLSSHSDTSCSSSARDYELSDIEDYDVKGGKRSKRRSRSERDRLKNNGSYHNGEESSPIYNGRNNRKWFPDEHQRGIDIRPPVTGRPKPTFMSTFVTNSRRNSPSIEEDFVTV